MKNAKNLDAFETNRPRTVQSSKTWLNPPGLAFEAALHKSDAEPGTIIFRLVLR